MRQRCCRGADTYATTSSLECDEEGVEKAVKKAVYGLHASADETRQCVGEEVAPTVTFEVQAQHIPAAACILGGGYQHAAGIRVRGKGW